MTARLKIAIWLAALGFAGSALIAVLQATVPALAESHYFGELFALCSVAFGGGLVILLGERNDGPRGAKRN